MSDIDHCKVVLRRLAHFHAFSMIITRDANMSLLDLYPFAVDASTFREAYQSRVAIVKYELCKYLMASSNDFMSNLPKYIFTCIQIDEICFIYCNYFYVMSCDIIKRITLS